MRNVVLQNDFKNTQNTRIKLKYLNFEYIFPSNKNAD